MNFSDAAKDMRALFYKLFDATIKDGAVEYDGTDITTPHILATCFSIKQNFEKLDYNLKNGRDKLDIYIQSIFHLGYQSCVEHLKPEMDLLRFNSKTMCKMVEGYQKEEKLNILSIDDVVEMIPTDSEAESYANNSFGYEYPSSEKEEAFARGVEWVRDEMNRKLEELKK